MSIQLSDSSQADYASGISKSDVTYDKHNDKCSGVNGNASSRS